MTEKHEPNFVLENVILKRDLEAARQRNAALEQALAAANKQINLHNQANLIHSRHIFALQARADRADGLQAALTKIYNAIGSLTCPTCNGQKTETVCRGCQNFGTIYASKPEHVVAYIQAMRDC